MERRVCCTRSESHSKIFSKLTVNWFRIELHSSEGSLEIAKEKISKRVQIIVGSEVEGRISIETLASFLRISWGNPSCSSEVFLESLER